MRVSAMSFATGATTCALEVVDLVLVAMSALFQTVRLLARALRKDKELPKPSVVIVGASFAGLWAQRALSDHFDVTLIDMKDYFEYTPGVLRLFVEPEHLHRIARPLPSRRHVNVVAEVTEVTPSKVCVRHPSGETSEIPFDYLLLACGSNYPAVHGSNVVKAGPEQPSLEKRAAQWKDAADRLAAAEDAIVVGGGPVGVELAAEIAAAYPEKRVVLVSRSERLCAALPHRVGELCLHWLQRHQVEVLRGLSTSQIREDGVTLSNGRELRAAVVYNCAGSLPNNRMLTTHFGTQLDGTGRLLVDDHLRVKGHKNIFAMGDLMRHMPSDELKLGHTAELNSHVVVHNVLASAAGGADGGHPLVSYPEGAHGLSQSPQVYCVALGKDAAVLSFNGLVLGGWFAGLNKWLLEWTKVAACEERPVGTLFWHVADSMTAVLSKTVLPVPMPAAATAAS